MASNKEYLDFILGQLSEVDGVSYRPMMGEYLLYVQGKLIGGIYDDRFHGFLEFHVRDLVFVRESHDPSLIHRLIREQAQEGGAVGFLDYVLRLFSRDAGLAEMGQDAQYL